MTELKKNLLRALPFRSLAWIDNVLVHWAMLGYAWFSLGERTTLSGPFLMYSRAADVATLMLPGVVWERVGFCTGVRLGTVFVYRRIGDVSTFRPSLKFF